MYYRFVPDLSQIFPTFSQICPRFSPDFSRFTPDLSQIFFLALFIFKFHFEFKLTTDRLKIPKAVDMLEISEIFKLEMKRLKLI